MKLRLLPAATTAALVAIVGVTGCGGGSAAGRSAAPVTPRAAVTTPGTGGGVTAGRIGDATAAASGQAPHVLSPGGALRPHPSTPGTPDRDGVAVDVPCAGADALPETLSPAANNAAVLCLLNGVRAAAGLPGLTENAKLDAAAAPYAQAMVAQQFFAHVGVDGSTMTDRLRATGYLVGTWSIGENIAWGSGSLSTPRSVMTGWMNSQGHRDNIMNPEFRDVGLGVALGTPSVRPDQGAVYVNDFGTSTPDPVDDPDPQVSPAPKPATAPRAQRAPGCSGLRSAGARRTCAAAAKRRSAAAKRKAAAARRARVAWHKARARNAALTQR